MIIKKNLRKLGKKGEKSETTFTYEYKTLTYNFLKVKY